MHFLQVHVLRNTNTNVLIYCRSGYYLAIIYKQITTKKYSSFFKLIIIGMSYSVSFFTFLMGHLATKSETVYG